MKGTIAWYAFLLVVVGWSLWEMNRAPQIVRVGECEYVQNYRGLTHKGDCDNWQSHHPVTPEG